jgi:hypothetical protein
MPRRVQDIIPANRRSIREIPVVHPSGKKAPEKKAEEPVKIHKDDRPINQPVSVRRMPITPPPTRREKRRFPWIASIIGAIIIIAGLSFALSGHFASATFTIVPKSVPVTVNGVYVIPATATVASPLSYGVMTITGNASTTVPATLGQNIQTKAIGSVTLYNAYSSLSQKLVAGTRLANDSGLIYRLTSTTVIPGYTTSSGNTIPGSIAAAIVADQSGANYNVSSSDPLSDFKVMAYKGTPKYAGFYARLVSNITGGFNGARTTVAPNTLASTTADLSQSLSASLRDKAARSVPSGYITYSGAFTQSFAAPSVASVGSNSASVAVTGTLYSLIFKESDLAAFLASSSSTDTFGSSSYDSPGLDTLSFSIANPNTFSPAKKTSLVAKISGSFKLVGSVPVDALKKALAGVSLANTGNILKKYASVIDIQDSFGDIAPPWVSGVPSDISRISINISKP